MSCLFAVTLALMLTGCGAIPGYTPSGSGTAETAPANAPVAANAVASDKATNPVAAPAPIEGGLQAQRIAGVWEGRSIAQCLAFMPDPGRCAAMQTITFTMFQSGDQVTGYYKCAYGNQLCRNLNENGVIKNGKMIKTRLMMRVMLPDGSMCFFTGIPRDDHFNGGYSCLQGAGLIEQGRFYTQRSY